MRLSQRDKRALILLAIVVPIMTLFFFGDRLMSILRADSPEYVQARSQFMPIYEKMNSFERWRSEVSSSQERLHIKVSTSHADQQKDEFLKTIEDEGLKRKVQITGHRWLRVTRSTKSPGVEKRAFQIDCVGNFAGIIDFVKGIEELAVPVVIDEISLSRRTTGPNPQGRPGSGGPGGPNRGGGGPGRGGGQDEHQLKATLQLHLFIFPQGAADDQASS